MQAVGNSERSHMVKQDLGKTSTGLKPNAAALLSYLLGFISGIAFLVIEKENKFVRFHALQSIITFGAIFALQWVCELMTSLYPLIRILELLAVILWAVLMYKAYLGEKFKLPVIGDIAEQNS